MKAYVNKWRKLDGDGTALYYKRGQLLADAKQKLPHGEWKAFLDEIDIKQRSATRYIRIFNLSSNWPTVAEMNLVPLKLDQLARLNEDQLEMFLSEYDADLEYMSVRDLTKLVSAFLHPDKKNSGDIRVYITLSPAGLEAIQTAYPDMSIRAFCQEWVDKGVYQIMPEEESEDEPEEEPEDETA